MPEVHRFALVPHPAGEMFGLVADVERYPEFLSWVRAARIHERDAEHQLASLDIEVAGLRRTITTRNALVADRRLDMYLERGPFRHFAGTWEFQPLDGGCRVDLTLSFAFDNPILAAAFQRSFTRLAGRMVDDFCRRADALHG